MEEPSQRADVRRAQREQERERRRLRDRQRRQSMTQEQRERHLARRRRNYQLRRIRAENAGLISQPVGTSTELMDASVEHQGASVSLDVVSFGMVTSDGIHQVQERLNLEHTNFHVDPQNKLRLNHLKRLARALSQHNDEQTCTEQIAADLTARGGPIVVSSKALRLNFIKRIARAMKSDSEMIHCQNQCTEEGSVKQKTEGVQSISNENPTPLQQPQQSIIPLSEIGYMNHMTP